MDSVDSKVKAPDNEIDDHYALLDDSYQTQYANHLAQVNESSEVFSTEDIVSEQGILLCKKGTRITKRMAENLLQHKLIHPIENQVQVAGAIDNNDLANQFLALFDRQPALAQINDALEGTSEILERSRYYKLHPILSQKLTVMQKQLPDQFEDSLFIAWLASLIAREMKLDKETRNTIWVGGLFHDIGFLHLPPELGEKEGLLSSADWRAKQAHTIIGKMILENIPGLRPEIAQTVFEHHERGDGSGYPCGTNSDKLTVAGQVVAMASTVNDYIKAQLQPKGLNWSDMQPLLNLDADAHSKEVYLALSAMIRRLNLQPQRRAPAMLPPEYAKQLLNRGKALKEAVAILLQRQVFEQIKLVNHVDMAQSLFKVSDRVLHLSSRSGLISDEIFSWLENVSPPADEDEMLELAEVELIQDELKRQLTNSIYIFLASMTEEAFSGTFEYASLIAVLQDVEACLERM